MKLLFYDTETGGLDHRVHALMEVSALVVDSESREVLGEMSSLVRPHPDTIVEPEVLELHGRPLEQYYDEGREEHVVIDGVRKFACRHFGEPKRCSIIAHNSQFDYDFTNTACERNSLPLPFNRAHICSMHLFRSLRMAGHHNSYRANLESMMETFGVQLSDTDRHRAAGDVKALASCYLTMLQLIRPR